ncbi:putative uncharacterized protein DDB_G0287183 [Eurytemora carolleeae]|uniref:putative uncharacterized protein DDB_G0287183 n=1 Tax=Eurytemora carolleeae TaxID=1294199 RepID=UPI000C777EB3|nr:putative uncharacterized protein DDB_G0287183 [Eurytemora carolleeae]|eukprot:XP_023347999.1 putative uncharacterized protein DDB_G0287183 [Eurytemora affinis]
MQRWCQPYYLFDVSHFKCGGGVGNGGCDAGAGGGGCGAGGEGCGAGGGGGGSGGSGAGGLIGIARLETEVMVTSENNLQVPVLQPARGLSSGFDVSAKSEESLNNDLELEEKTALD